MARPPDEKARPRTGSGNRALSETAVPNHASSARAAQAALHAPLDPFLLDEDAGQGRRLRVRVAVDQNGRYGVDLRLWAAVAGELRPTRKGVRLLPGRALRVAEALRKASSELERLAGGGGG